MASVIEKIKYAEAIELLGYNIYISEKSNYYFDEKKNTILIVGTDVDAYELKAVIIVDEDGLHIKPRWNSAYTVVKNNVYIYSESEEE